MKTKFGLGFVLHASILVLPLAAFAQGSLTPPAAPAPTMKTLTQIEPRIPIDHTMIPLTINSSGSYYLMENLSVSGTSINAITIAAGAPNTTIDLNGFVISGTGTGDMGVSVNAVNCTVKNGSITGMFAGVFASAGTSVSDVAASGGAYGFETNNGASGCQFRRCSASSCSGYGWRLFGNGCLLIDCAAYANVDDGVYVNGGTHCTLIHCLAEGSTNGAGFALGSQATVANCSANNNGTGIVTGADSNVIGCTTAGNTGDGISVGDGCGVRDSSASDNGHGSVGGFGIRAGNGVSILHCNASANGNIAASGGGLFLGNGATVNNCSLYGNVGFGLQAGDGSMVSGNSVRENGGDGIRVDAGSVVLSNTCDYNGRTINASSGIRASGSFNRIEGNNVTSTNFNSSTTQGFGIVVSAGRNVIIKNSAGTNTGTSLGLNYSIAGGNRYGPIVDLTASGSPAVSGNSAAGTTVSTDPQANFAY